MSTNALKTALSRFTADYGMVYVLLLLCACFSVATYQEQHPEDATAGRQLANKIAIKHGGKRVVILAETAERAEDIDVARAERSRDRASERIQKTGKPDELDRARSSLKRSEARLEVAKSKS